MKNFIITEQQLQGIVDYLRKRPYGEVAQGIELLSSLPEYQQDKPVKNK